MFWKRAGHRILSWSRFSRSPNGAAPLPEPLRIGLALGGGFARGIAHVGVLRVLERNNIPVHCVAGVSAGSMVAAAYASGSTPDEIGAVASSMKFGHIARWSFCRMGFAGSERMERFLGRLLKCYRFEEMRLPLGVLAMDLGSGESVLFQSEGDVVLPIRASCSYPGLFQPVPWEGRLLVDGAMSMEVPALMARRLGATRVISVHLPMQRPSSVPSNMFQVVNRCFQILQSRAEGGWRELSDVVIAPDVRGVQWDGFKSAMQLVEAGEEAALAALPHIRAWLAPGGKKTAVPTGIQSPQTA